MFFAFNSVGIAFLWCDLERLLRWVSVAWLYGNSCLFGGYCLVLGLICDLVWYFVMLQIVGSRFRDCGLVKTGVLLLWLGVWAC